MMKKPKKKLFFFQFLLVFIFGCYLYSYHSENKKYEILNEIFADVIYNFEYICINKAFIDYHPEIFQEFSWIDKPSVYFQYWIQNFFGTFSDFRDWKINKIQQGKIKFRNESKKEFFSIILEDCSVELKKESRRSDVIIYPTQNPSNISVSLPILSSNGKKAIIQIISNCGLLCGSSQTYLFKKMGGKWKQAKQDMS